MIDYLSVFVIAFGAAFSHCIGMCGGIVLAASQNKITDSGFLRLCAGQLLYSFGRITTYAFIGAFAGFFGASIAVNNSAKGGVFIAIGLLMILFGILLFSAPKILRILEPNIANIGIFRRFFVFLLSSKKLYSFYVLGLLNGVIPCGIVYFFALSAAAAGSIWGGMLVMIVFGVATIFPLFIIGAISASLMQGRIKNIIAKITYLMIIAFGAWNVFKGFKILFTGG